MRRALLAIVATLLPLLSACGGNSTSVTHGCSGTGDVVVGVIAPQTGAAHEIVGSFTTGAEQAATDVNAKGGVCGGRNLRIVIKDNQSDFSNDAALAKQLVEQDHAAGVVLISDADFDSAGSYLQQKGVLTVGAFTGDKLDSPTTAKDTFSVAIPNKIEAKLWSAYLFKVKKVSRPAVLFETTSSFGQVQTDAFCADAQANNTPCVAREKTTLDTTDVSTQIADMKANNADSILLEGFGNPVVRTITTARAAGLNGPILGTGTAATSTGLVASLAPEAARQGYVYVNYRTASQGDPQAATSLAAELKQNNLISEPLFVPMFSHDAVELMAAGWNGAKSLNGDDASKFIETINHKVGDGTYTLHDAVYSADHHEPQVNGWLTLCVATPIDTNGLAAVSPDTAAALAAMS